MPERLVDVEKGSKVLHHVFLLRLAPPQRSRRSREGVGGGGQRLKLISNEELTTVWAPKMHVSRGGQLTPYGDPHGVLAETKAGLNQGRSRACLSAMGAGGAAGWTRRRLLESSAASTRFCERAYAL